MGVDWSGPSTTSTYIRFVTDATSSAITDPQFVYHELDDNQWVTFEYTNPHELKKLQEIENKAIELNNKVHNLIRELLA